MAKWVSLESPNNPGCNGGEAPLLKTPTQSIEHKEVKLVLNTEPSSTGASYRLHVKYPSRSLLLNLSSQLDTLEMWQKLEVEAERAVFRSMGHGVEGNCGAAATLSVSLAGSCEVSGPPPQHSPTMMLCLLPHRQPQSFGPGQPVVD